MKKMIFSALALFFAASALAQQTTSSTGSEPKSEWLPSFEAIVISAPVDIELVRVVDSEAPKITYDTKGSYTTKFKAEVKGRTLRITERSDSRRPERTTVTVYFNSLTSLSISDAVAKVDGMISAPLFDLRVGGGAKFEGQLEVSDLNMELSDRASATITGKARYMTLSLSTGKLDASALEVMSLSAAVSSGGVASMWITDRLDVTTSTRGVLNYKGTPSIIRGGVKFMGGTINKAE